MSLQDVSAIEARNNALELQSANNGRLLVALEDLVGRLTQGQAAEEVLRGQEITAAK